MFKMTEIQRIRDRVGYSKDTKNTMKRYWRKLHEMISFPKIFFTNLHSRARGHQAYWNGHTDKVFYTIAVRFGNILYFTGFPVCICILKEAKKTWHDGHTYKMVDIFSYTFMKCPLCVLQEILFYFRVISCKVKGLRTDLLTAAVGHSGS